MRHSATIKIATLFAAALFFSSLSFPARAADTLKIAVVNRGLWEPSVHEIAIRDGLFKREGIDVELFYTQSTGEQLQALLAGSVDIAVGIGMLSVLGANSKGANIDVIAATSTGSRDIFFYVRSDSSIRTFNDIAGKTIAYTGAGSSSHLAVLALLSHYKIAAKPLAGGGLPAILTSVLSGQIDVGMSAAPFNLSAVEEGSIRVIGRASEVPALRDQTTRVVAVLRSTFDARRDVLVRYVRAVGRARDAMYEDAQLEWFGGLQKLSLEQIKRSMSLYLPPESTQLADVKGLDLSIEQAKQFKFVQQDFRPAQFEGHIRVLGTE